jgi:hypothetical protein
MTMDSLMYGLAEVFFEQISRSGIITYLHHDQQGSTRLLTGASGAAEATMSYDARRSILGQDPTLCQPHTIIAVVATRELSGFCWAITQIERKLPAAHKLHPVGWAGGGPATRREPATDL